MAIDDLLDRARDARRRRDEAAGELVALVRALEGLEGVGMLDATQKRELGRAARASAREAQRRPARHEAPCGGSAMTAIRSGHGPRPGWPELAAGVVGALWRWRVELALLAGVLLAWRLLAGAVGPVGAACLVAWALAGVLASPLGARAAGADAAGAAAAAPVPARTDRRRPAAREAGAAAARSRPASSPRSGSRRAGRSRTSTRAASGWRRRSGCASCASRATPPTPRAAP